MGPGPRGKIEKLSKNCQNQLFQNSGKQKFVSTSQMLNKWKGNLKIPRKALWYFYVFGQFSSWAQQWLWRWPHSQFGTLVPGSGGSRADLICKMLSLSALTYCRECMKDWCKVLVFVPPNLELTQVIVVVRLFSCVRLFATPWTAALLAFLSITNSQNFLKLHWVGDAIQSSHALSSLSLPALNLPQHQGLFPVNWSFASGGQSTGASASSSVQHSNEYSGLISFIIDWFDLLAVQGTLKSLIQHHSSEASILRCSTFFMVQLSHLYMSLGP